MRQNKLLRRDHTLKKEVLKHNIVLRKGSRTTISFLFFFNYLFLSKPGTTLRPKIFSRPSLSIIFSRDSWRDTESHIATKLIGQLHRQPCSSLSSSNSTSNHAILYLYLHFQLNRISSIILSALIWIWTSLLFFLRLY